MIAHIDIETYSSVDIKSAGAYKYALSPDFDILIFGYAVGDEPVRVLDLTRGDAADADEILRLLYDDSMTFMAYNAAFEWWCINRWLKRRGTPEIPASRWRCVMAHALYCGYPAGLAATGAAVGLPEDKRKLGIGSALIRKFCVPHKPTKTDPRMRILPNDEPEKWQLFLEYNRQDVVTEREIEHLLAPWPMPETEQSLWALDVEMNAHGTGVDVDLVHGALAIDETTRAQLTAEAVALTGISNPRSVKQLTAWLNEELDTDESNALTSLRKADVAELLDGDLTSDRARRVLELRQLLGKSSTSKYASMEAACCPDNRVRGLLQYYGANRTGRWAGRLVQVQNLPRNYLETLDIAREIVKSEDGDALGLIYGNIPDTLSQLIRTAFVPLGLDGKPTLYAIADYSAIEARVIAWLAGETWVNEVFATHGKIYEATAAQMFGVPVERIKKGNPEYALRQKGKVATLALGYQGWTAALTAMGALKMGITEEELPDIAGRWREANPHIVQLWYAMERAALAAVETGAPQQVRCLILRVEGGGEQRFLTIQLPSGRKLFYAKPGTMLNDRGKTAVYYQGVDQTTKKWTQIPMYGGKWVENCVQAIARDALALTLLRLRDAGYQTVFHVHDEVIVELQTMEDCGDLDRILAIMATPVPWAPGLILRGAGFTAGYYQKD